MTFRLLTAFACVAATTLGRAADEEPNTKTSSHMKEILRARATEDAKKQAAAPAPAKPGDKPAAPAAAPVGVSKTEAPGTSPAATPPPAPVKAKEAPSAKETAAKTAQQPATVLPKVEVKKGRITVLDQQIAKQEEDIAREKKNTKTSEVDLALNDSKIAQPLSILGGESAQFRKRVASERVELMEAEKDILEAMKLARTKKEKEELQKQLDELRAMRRELDKSLR